MTILYITQNGITDHIGRSQVAPYILGLARVGYQLHVLSAEKPSNEKLIAYYQDQFDRLGVHWTRVTYRNRPPFLGQLLTQWTMAFHAWNIVRSRGIGVVHCRSFPAAVIAYRLRKLMNIRFIFDFRDFYADGNMLKTRGLFWLAYRYMKHLEGPMIRSASKVICLTRRAAEILNGWYMTDREGQGAHFTVIPCCADFDLFDLSRISDADVELARQRAALRSEQFVLLYLGSLGPDYLLPQMIALFRQVMAVRSDAVFLFVCNNGKDLVEIECDAQGVGRDKIRFVSADRDEVPALISLANMSVVFIRADLSKAGCSPTKLAELFACNVPVIANAGVGDMDDILNLEENGSVIVKDFSDAELREAVKKVIACKTAGRVNIRHNSRRFSLEQGISLYARSYAELLKS